jgi:hypothetical protein
MEDPVMGADTSRSDLRSVLKTAPPTALPESPRPKALTAPRSALAPDVAAMLTRKSTSGLPWSEFFSRLQAGAAGRVVRSAAPRASALGDSIA